MIAGYDRTFLFLDIGANLGLFSLLAARHPLCRKVLAFEPLPAIFASLSMNIERNRAGKVEPHCCAISDAGSHVYLSYDPKHSGMSKVVADEMGSVRAKAMNATRLTEVVGKFEGAILAKIDVEGSELTVFSILRQTGFYAAVDAIIIEISERNLTAHDKAELLDLLEAEGFAEVNRNGTAEHYDAYYRRAT